MHEDCPRTLQPRDGCQISATLRRPLEMGLGLVKIPRLSRAHLAGGARGYRKTPKASAALTPVHCPQRHEGHLRPKELGRQELGRQSCWLQPHRGRWHQMRLEQEGCQQWVRREDEHRDRGRAVQRTTGLVQGVLGDSLTERIKPPRAKVRRGSVVARYQLPEDLRHMCVFSLGPPRWPSLPHPGGETLLATETSCANAVGQRVRRSPWRLDPVMRATNPILGPTKTGRRSSGSARNAASNRTSLGRAHLVVIQKSADRKSVV